MFQEDENSGGEIERKKMSESEIGKLLNSLDFSYFMLCSIIEDVLQDE